MEECFNGLTNISIALQGLMTKYHQMANKDSDKTYDIFLPGESEFLGKKVSDSVIVNDDPKISNNKEAVLKRVSPSPMQEMLK
jgi:hypothetical protein